MSAWTGQFPDTFCIKYLHCSTYLPHSFSPSRTICGTFQQNQFIHAAFMLVWLMGNLRCHSIGIMMCLWGVLSWPTLCSYVLQRDGTFFTKTLTFVVHKCVVNILCLIRSKDTQSYVCASLALIWNSHCLHHVLLLLPGVKLDLHDSIVPAALPPAHRWAFS